MMKHHPCRLLPKTELKPKSCKISSVHIIHFSYPIVINFAQTTAVQEHGSVTAMFCAKFLSDEATDK